jgi:hypothetical protein
MSLKRSSQTKRRPSAGELKRRELQGYLDKLQQVPNKTSQDTDLIHELHVALTRLKQR